MIRMRVGKDYDEHEYQVLEKDYSDRRKRPGERTAERESVPQSVAANTTSRSPCLRIALPSKSEGES
jgi:hypothetical protein